MPSRVIPQDFTGVPVLVDIAAMRAAVARLGGNPQQINPLVPVDLVIDHSVQVDHFRNQGRFCATSDSSTTETASATRLCAGAKVGAQLPRGSSGDGHRPPGQPGIFGARRGHAGSGTACCSLSPIPWSAPTHTRR